MPDHRRSTGSQYYAEYATNLQSPSATSARRDHSSPNSNTISVTTQEHGAQHQADYEQHSYSTGKIT